MSAERFFETYERKLAEAVRRNPADYMYGPDQVPAVAAKMRAAWERGTASKHGSACAATCRELGIKHTYKAIREFMAAASVALIALGGVAHAQSYADDVCRELRAQRPGLVAPIAVIGHHPVTVNGKLTDETTAWMCPPTTASGFNLPPVKAETYVPDGVRNPYQCEGVEDEDGCLVRNGVAIGTHFRRN